MDKCKPDNIAQEGVPSVKVTVFTPTYNRRHTLERLYRSLQKQTFRDFEWLIVDDGSADDTESQVAKWQKEEKFFPIRYQWKPNGGKHTAHNLGISLAYGEYFAILDSDDWYTPDALAVLTAEWDVMPVEIKKLFSNIEGLCCYEDGRMIGQIYPLDVYDSDNISIQRLCNRPLDTMGMFRLIVLREFPFPDNFEGCFVPESLVWDRIAEKYRTRFLNVTVGYKEYLPEGLTKRPLKARVAKSEPHVIYYREMAARKSTPFFQKLKCILNVYRYSFHNRLSIIKQIQDDQYVLVSFAFVLFGYIVYLKDRMAILLGR